MKKVLLLLICLLLILNFMACNGQNQEEKKEKIVIFMSSFDSVGQEDHLVCDALEKAFYEDTGINIDIDLKLYSQADFKTKVSLAMSNKNEQLDAIVRHTGIDDGLGTYIRDGHIMAIDELLELYGQNLLSKIPEKDFEILSMNGKRYGVPSVEHSSRYGILIRKDWLDGGNVPETIEEFETMLQSFKQRDPNNVIPLVGPPWDIEIIFAGAMNTFPYHTFDLNEEGKYVPTFMLESRKEFLSMLYRWVSNGYWDVDNRNRSKEDCETLFITGKAGVFLYNPNVTSLITLARKTKQINPEAEFEIIGPLKNSEGEINGFYYNANNTGVCIPKSAKNPSLVIKYLDWLQSKKDNYELAMYGIAGKHWVKVGENKRAYPEGYDETARPKYTTSYRLITNVLISDRDLSSYSAEEERWMQESKNYKTFKAIGDGLILPPFNNIDAINAWTAAYSYFNKEIHQAAWTGINDPSAIKEGTTSRFDYYLNNLYVAGEPYLTFLNNEYLKTVTPNT